MTKRLTIATLALLVLAPPLVAAQDAPTDADGPTSASRPLVDLLRPADVILTAIGTMRTEALQASEATQVTRHEHRREMMTSAVEAAEHAAWHEEQDRIAAEQAAATEVQAAAAPAVASIPAGRWDVLAECESNGEWDYGPHSGWGSGIYHGGLQFHPNTWSSFGGGQYATYAYQATREQQIAIAERVLAAQGWGAWPACTRKLGWR